MTKLLMMITGLGAISASSIPVVSKSAEESNINTKQILATAKEWSLDPIVVKKVVDADDWWYFAIDNINLSSLGINSIEDLHTYKTIEIPDFFIRFYGKTYVDKTGDSWEAKRNLGSENWFRIYWKVIDGVTMMIERASTIWINESNELMMRLAYHASLSVAWPSQDPDGGLITFKSGSVVKFY